MSILTIQTIMKYSCESCEYVSFESPDDVQKHILQSHIGIDEEIIPRLIDACKTIFQSRNFTNNSDLKKLWKKDEKLIMKSEIVSKISGNNSPIDITKSPNKIRKRRSDDVTVSPCKKRKFRASSAVNEEFSVDIFERPCPKFIKMGKFKTKILPSTHERPEHRTDKVVYRYSYSERVLRKLMAVYDPPITEDLLTKVKPIATFPMSFSVVEHKKRYHCETCHYSSVFSHADLKRHIFLRHCKISWKYRQLMLTVSRIDKKSMQLLSDKELIEKINREISRGKLTTFGSLTDSEDEFPVEMTKKSKVPLKEKNGVDNEGEFLNKILNEQRKRSLAENEVEGTNQGSVVETVDRNRKQKRKSYLNENEIDSIVESAERGSAFGTKPLKNKKIDFVADSPEGIKVVRSKSSKKKKDEADDFKKSAESIAISDFKSKADMKKIDFGDINEFTDSIVVSDLKPKKKTKKSDVGDVKESIDSANTSDIKLEKRNKAIDINESTDSVVVSDLKLKKTKKIDFGDINESTDSIVISDLKPKKKTKKSDADNLKESNDNVTYSNVKSKKTTKKNEVIGMNESIDISESQPKTKVEKNNAGDSNQYINRAVTTNLKPKKKNEIVDINESINNIVTSYLKPKKKTKKRDVDDLKVSIDSATTSAVKPNNKKNDNAVLDLSTSIDTLAIPDLKCKINMEKSNVGVVTPGVKPINNEIIDINQCIKKIPASKRKSLSNFAEESVNKIPSLNLKPAQNRKDSTAEKVSDTVPFFEIFIVKKSKADSVDEFVDKIPIFKIKRSNKKNEVDNADDSIDNDRISMIKSHKKEMIAVEDESLEEHLKENIDNNIAQTTNNISVSKRKSISKKNAVPQEHDSKNVTPNSKNRTPLTESQIGSSELSNTLDESKYYFPFSERVLQKYIEVSSPPIEENLIKKMKILNHCPMTTVTVNNRNRFTCETCNYVSDISNVDIKRHIFRRHCNISNLNREIILKVSRTNFDKQLWPDSELINEINNEISVGKLTTTTLLTDSEDESGLSIPKSKRTTSFEKKDLRLIGKEKFSYNEEVLRFRCTKNKLDQRFEELKQKMDIFQNYGMEVYKRNDQNVYMCSHCNWYSKNCRSDVIKHVMNTYAGFSKENKSCKRMVQRSVAKIKTVRKNSKK